MDAFQKNIAVARGEAIAAHVLASAALQMLFMMIPNKEQALVQLSAFFDDMLNVSGPANGDADDEFNTQLRETARFHAMQALDGIGQMIRNMPGKN